MKDADRLREAKKQVNIVANRHDLPVLSLVYANLQDAIYQVEHSDE